MAGFLPGEIDESGAVGATNPFMPSKLQTLGMMLSGLGSGISAASARNLPAYYGIAPGAQAFSNAYGNLLARGANYDLASKRYALEKENADVTKQYREAQIADLKRQSDIDAALMKGLPGVLGGTGGNTGATPGFRPQRTLLGPGDYSDITAGTESGGRYDAVNPTSGATGKFQFMPSTARDVAAFHPELGLPFDVSKWTPEQQEIGMKALTADNAKFLTAHGVSPTPSNLYLAHRFGAQGAVNFLSADDNAPVASVVPASWVAQNPDLQGVTVGQFKAGVGQRYGGVPAGVPQMPGPPPANTDLLPYMVSKRLAPFATFAASQRERQYEDAWKRYQAEQQARQFAATNANNDVTLDPVTGLPTVNQTKIEAGTASASAQEKAKKDVDIGYEGASKLIQGRMDNYEKTLRPQAITAANDIENIYQARQLLDSGVITGPGANTALFLSKVAPIFGFDANTVNNTQAFLAQGAKRVMGVIKNLGSGSGISDSDREYAAKAEAGSITANEGAIRRILEINEKADRALLKQHDQESQRLLKVPGVKNTLGEDYFSLPSVPSYDEWKKANPLASPAPTSTPTPNPAPQQGGQRLSPEDARKLPPGTPFIGLDGVPRVRR